jgi:hypothetical protein
LSPVPLIEAYRSFNAPFAVTAPMTRRAAAKAPQISLVIVFMCFSLSFSFSRNSERKFGKNLSRIGKILSSDLALEPQE